MLQGSGGPANDVHQRRSRVLPTATGGAANGGCVCYQRRPAVLQMVIVGTARSKRWVSGKVWCSDEAPCCKWWVTELQRKAYAIVNS
jgi:hypothetical protein